MEYEEFIHSKIVKAKESGFDVDETMLNKNLFDYQREIVKRAM